MMASDSSCSISFVGIEDGLFCFQEITHVHTRTTGNCFQLVDETDLQTDTFHKSPNKPSLHWMKNKGLFLVLEDVEGLCFKDLTEKEQQSKSDCKFFIQTYYKSPAQEKEGRVVFLFTKKDNDHMMVRCHQSGKDLHIKAERMDVIPDKIDNTGYETLFHLRKYGHKVIFESCLHGSHFLAFQDMMEGNPHPVKKLVLRKWSQEEVDETCIINKLKCY